MSDDKTNLKPKQNTPASKYSSDVFAYLSRFLPKRTDVLWVAQELERIHRLPDLPQREDAQRELYTKIERHIFASKLVTFTPKALRTKIRSVFSNEVETGFLKPLFSAQAKPVAKQPTQPVEKAEPAPQTWKFKNLKEALAKDSAIALMRTSSGRTIPVSLKGAAWKSPVELKNRLIVSIKDLRVAQRYMQDRLQTLKQALVKARSGDVSDLVSLEERDEGLEACVKIIKELEYDRHDKAQKIDHLRQDVKDKTAELKVRAKRIEEITTTLKGVSGQLQEKDAELADTKRSAVKRELEWQSRILELEQAKQTAVERELELQQHVAELEQAKQAAVKRELELQQHVAELEQAKQIALKQQQQVSRMKQEIEDFYQKLSQDV